MHLGLCLLTLPLHQTFLTSAMPAQHVKAAPEQAREDTSPAKIDVTSKSPVLETYQLSH